MIQVRDFNMRIYLTLLFVLFTACAWSADDVKEMEIVTKATAWLDAEPNKRSLSDGLDLIDICIFAQKEWDSDGPNRIDGVLNSILWAIATDGSSQNEVRLVNYIDHLFLRDGYHSPRTIPNLMLLFTIPEGSASWSDARRSEYLDRREPIVISIWSRINAGAKKVLAEGRPFLSVRKPHNYPGKSVEEHEKEMVLYRIEEEVQKVEIEKERLCVERNDFKDIRKYLIQDPNEPYEPNMPFEPKMTKWIRHWYLPNNLIRLNTVLSAAGFDLEEIKQISTGVK
jgi:hypothetical protein